MDGLVSSKVLDAAFGPLSSKAAHWHGIGWHTDTAGTLLFRDGRPFAVVAPMEGAFCRVWHRGDDSWPCAGFLDGMIVFSPFDEVHGFCRTQATTPLPPVPGTPRAYRAGDAVYWLGHRDVTPERPERFNADGVRATLITTLPRYPDGTRIDLVVAVEGSIPIPPVADACLSPSATPPSSPKTTSVAWSKAT